jgi:hypothetical protein
MDTLGVGYISIRIGVLCSTTCGGGGKINTQELPPKNTMMWSLGVP